LGPTHLDNAAARYHLAPGVPGQLISNPAPPTRYWAAGCGGGLAAVLGRLAVMWHGIGPAGRSVIPVVKAIGVDVVVMV
jgi:hypothetical protein